MRTNLLFLISVILIMIADATAQAPQLMNYQTVIRNSLGQPIANTTVNLQFQIRDATLTGNVLFTETDTATTNEFGLATVAIGKRSLLDTVNWGSSPKYLQIGVDITGHTSFTDMGTTQLLSVPYALYAEKTGNVNGIVNYLARFTPNGNTLSTSQLFDDGINVGIGNASPANKLEIGTATGFSGNDLAIGNNGQGMSFFQSADATTWYSTANFALMPFNGGNGFVGINNLYPANKLEIGQAPGFSGNDLAIGNSSYGMALSQSNTVSTWYSSTNFALMPNTGSGNVGIGTQTPTNKLQIGTYTNANYGGNQLALGFGTMVTVMNQASSQFNLQSSNYITIQAQHDIYLMPGNGNGYVGINTNAPVAPLEVDGYGDAQTLNDINYYNPDNTTHLSSYDGTLPSIYSQGTIVAPQFAAVSDKRIKNIHGISNSTADLETLNALKITDYTMKDVRTFGYHPYKKVIAQEVEEVYPQVVNKQQNYIPNVYRIADKVEKTEQGYLIGFNAPHGISNSASKIQVIDNSGKQRCNIVSVPDEKHILISAGKLGDEVFVYGELVNDFRTVDYEGLTTLNISATQELYKRIKALEAENKAVNYKLAISNTNMDAMANDISTLKQLVLAKCEK